MTNSADLDVFCLGILVADMFVSPLPALPAVGQLSLVDEIYPDTGGCAANTGVSLTKLGLRAGLSGKVGRDAFGDFITQDMAAKGLETVGIRRSATVGTSKTVIVRVIGEDRRYLHTFGANADFSLDDVDLQEVARAKVLYVGGYLVLPRLDQGALVRLLSFAKGRGLKTVLDVIVPGNRSDFRVATHLAEALPYTDVFLPNDDEAYLLTGESDPVAQARAFLACGCPNVVVTLGEKGALAATPREMVRAPVFPVDVVDPSGAGDAFDAGYIYGLLQGWGLRRTLEFASAIGASACTKLGCTPGVFTLPEAEAFLAKNHLQMETLS
ncbi:MAG: sugar kinase [Anaerolineae bacterium]|nr:sugar kinase [Anaerolineae bacterium]